MRALFIAALQALLCRVSPGLIHGGVRGGKLEAAKVKFPLRNIGCC